MSISNFHFAFENKLSSLKSQKRITQASIQCVPFALFTTY